MAITESRETVIDATPDEIMDVLFDLESLTEWSSAHQKVEILERDEQGRPKRNPAKDATIPGSLVSGDVTNYPPPSFSVLRCVAPLPGYRMPPPVQICAAPRAAPWAAAAPPAGRAPRSDRPAARAARSPRALR